MKKIIFLGLVIFSTNTYYAQNWTGAVDSDWNNAANWSETPSNGDDIEINPSNYTGAMAHPVVTGTSNFTPAEMLVQNGAQLTISGTLNASDRCEMLGGGTMVTINGGTFSLTGAGNNARLIIAEEAHLQMGSGNLNVGQRLLFELGGTGKVVSGTVTVGETIALVDGSINGPSKLIQNGGTITTNAEFGFENEAGEFYPVFEQAGGTLNVNGSLVWLGAAPGSGRGYFLSTGGTVNVTGTIGNDPTSTMGMHIELAGNGMLFQNSGNAVTTLAGDSIVLRNGAQWSDINTVSWQNNGTFYAEGGSLFKSGNTSLNGTGEYQFDQVEIPTLKLLNHITPAQISIGGNLDVAGTFNHNNNKLVLNGALQQTVSATTLGLNLYDLEIANEAEGISVNNHLNILHSLNLVDGIVNSVPTATIKLSDNAIVSGGTDSTFVDGYMEKTGNDAIEFPIGSSPDRYRPFSVSAPVSELTVIRVAYKFSPYSSLTPVQTPLQSVSGIEYWDISRTGSTDLFSAILGWNDASQSGLSNCDDISMTIWNGTQWTFVASTTTGLCDGTNAGTLSSSSPLPAIGPVTIGFTEDVYQNVVELCAGETISIGANTYSESGVYIDVLDDANGNDSTVVTMLTVHEPLVIAVTNNTTHLVANETDATYQWIDCNNQNAIITGETGVEFYPTTNGSYAVVVTKNGCSDTSNCAIINQLDINELTSIDLAIYPNPVEGNGELMVVASEEIETFQILSLDGKVIPVKSISTEGFKSSVSLPDLTAGTYLLEVKSSRQLISVKRFTVF